MHRRGSWEVQGLPFRLAGGLARLAFGLALATVLILGAVRFAFSWQPVYTYALETYHADAVTGIPLAELQRATHEIRNYFTNGRRDLEITVSDSTGRRAPLFQAREIQHMRDVKALVARFYLLLDVAAAYLFAYTAFAAWVLHRPARALAALVLRSSVATLLGIIAFGVAASYSFDSLFTEFHLLSFSNDFWQLDPATDHLVQIFPQGFWFDVTAFVGLLALGSAALLALLSGGYLLLSRQPRLRPSMPHSAPSAPVEVERG